MSPPQVFLKGFLKNSEHLSTAVSIKTLKNESQNQHKKQQKNPQRFPSQPNPFSRTILLHAVYLFLRFKLVCAH